jgi:hypothetical protein
VAVGGPAIQVTRGGGHYAQESWDGRSVYYWKNTGGGEIRQVPVEGGEEMSVVRVRKGGRLSGWDLSAAGIYYAISRNVEVGSEEYTVCFLDIKSGRTETLFRKEGSFGHWSLSVSPDEKWILFGELPAAQSEIMLIENFR